MHAVGSGSQCDVEPVIYDQKRAMPAADRPQYRSELVKLAPVEVLFAKLERDTNDRLVAGERDEDLLADLGESARCDEATVANQVEPESGWRTERAVQLSL
jgi:hypothetical protein